MNRFQEPPRSGIFCDILWSDPVDNDEQAKTTLFKNNNVRGCSHFFGLEATNRFLDKNHLLSIIRAHEA